MTDLQKVLLAVGVFAVARCASCVGRSFHSPPMPAWRCCGSVMTVGKPGAGGISTRTITPRPTAMLWLVTNPFPTTAYCEVQPRPLTLSHRPASPTGWPVHADVGWIAIRTQANEVLVCTHGVIADVQLDEPDSLWDRAKRALSQ